MSYIAVAIGSAILGAIVMALVNAGARADECAECQERQRRAAILPTVPDVTIRAVKKPVKHELCRRLFPVYYYEFDGPLAEAKMNRQVEILKQQFCQGLFKYYCPVRKEEEPDTGAVIYKIGLDILVDEEATHENQT